jgi:hypothetical protein
MCWWSFMLGWSDAFNGAGVAWRFNVDPLLPPLKDHSTLLRSEGEGHLEERKSSHLRE